MSMCAQNEDLSQTLLQLEMEFGPPMPMDLGEQHAVLSR